MVWRRRVRPVKGASPSWAASSSAATPALFGAAVAFLLVMTVWVFFACSRGSTEASSPETSAAMSVTPSTSTSVAAPAEVPGLWFGETTRPRPGRVILSDRAKAFVPPDSMPLFRIEPVTITEAGMRELADRLGMPADRKYSSPEPPDSFGAVAAGGWVLTFYRGDLHCFDLRLLEGDEEAIAAFERGEEVQAVSEEEAVAVVDEYLSAHGFREGLGEPRAFVRTSVGRTGGGRPELSELVITRGVSYPVTVGGLRLIGAGVTVDVAPGGKVIGFSHKLQEAVRDQVEVPILPVEEAAKDVEAGEGLLPGGARIDNVSEVTIKDVELGYYDPPPALVETHYRPVYVFRVRLADGSEGTWLVSAYRGVRR